MLTAGATSTLLNRLEAAGHIVRTREHSDRRIVTLHSTEAIHASAAAFYAPLAERLDSILRGYSPHQLDTVLEVVTALSAALSAATTAGTRIPMAVHAAGTAGLRSTPTLVSAFPSGLTQAASATACRMIAHSSASRATSSTISMTTRSRRRVQRIAEWEDWGISGTLG